MSSADAKWRALIQNLIGGTTIGGKCQRYKMVRLSDLEALRFPRSVYPHVTMDQ